MNADLYTIDNTKAGTIELPEAMFGAPWRPALVQQVLLAQQANARRPWAHAKGRGEVSGGGKKPWKQKGTGRARHGSIRSPLWRGGGKAHGPSKERDYSQKVNKKMKQQAVASVLSKKLKDGSLKVFESFALESPKTKVASTILRTITGIAPKAKRFDALIIRDPENKNLTRAARNLVKTKVLSPNSLNIYDLLNYKHVFVEKNAIVSLRTKD
jgi:large subunit ribosomal protein L4